MNEEKAPPPNTYVVEVSFWSGLWWGNYLWLAQEMVGMTGPRRHGSNNELDTKKYDAEHLREYFEEEKLGGDVLGFTLYLDQDYHTTPVATIETSLSYGTEVSDEMFLHIVNDYVAHMHSMPLADPAQAITEEEREEEMVGHSIFMFEHMEKFAPRLLESKLLSDMKAARERREKPWKDIEF